MPSLCGASEAEASAACMILAIESLAGRQLAPDDAPLEKQDCVFPLLIQLGRNVRQLDSEHMIAIGE